MLEPPSQEVKFLRVLFIPAFADRVHFIDVYDARRYGFGLFEQVAHTGCTQSCNNIYSRNERIMFSSPNKNDSTRGQLRPHNEQSSQMAVKNWDSYPPKYYTYSAAQRQIMPRVIKCNSSYKIHSVVWNNDLQICHVVAALDWCVTTLDFGTTIINSGRP